MKYIVKKLGNELKQIEEIYASDLCDDDESLNKLTKRLFKKYLKSVKFGPNRRNEISSFFGTEHRSGVWNWHYDGGCGPLSMIISSYPNPTHIIVPNPNSKKSLIYLEKILSCWEEDALGDSPNLHRFVEEGLEKKYLKVFVPEPGDIYYLGKRVLHTVNPADHEKMHLCARIWNPHLRRYKNESVGRKISGKRD